MKSDNGKTEFLTADLDVSPLFDAYPDAVFVLADDGRILRANQSAVKFYGYTLKELILMNAADLAAVDLRDQAPTHIHNALKSGDRFDWRHRRKDGTELPVNIYARPIRYHGEPAILASVRDITEYTQTKIALQENNARQFAVLENLKEGIVVSDSEGQVVYGNPAILSILGFASTDKLLRNLYEFGDTFDIRTVEENRSIPVEDWAMHRVLRGEVLQDWEVRLCRLDEGWEKILSFTGWIIQSESGEKLGFISATDITERKRSEKDLRLNEERLRVATEQGGVAVWEYDFATNSMARSDNHDRLYGLERQEKWDINTFLSATHPDDRDISNSKIQSAVAPGGEDHYSFEFRVIYPDKSIHWLMVSGNVTERNMQGEGRVVQGCLIDITEIKQTEMERKRFFMLAESSSEFIGMCDLDMNPIYVNPAGRRMVGLADMEAACRVKVEDYFFPEDRELMVEEFFPKVLREGQGGMEVRLRHFQTGDPVWVFYNLFSVQDDAGATIGWATVSHDISERKNMQRRQEEDARKLNKALVSTIESIAATVEKRDAYTASHQERVARLAKAIGVELGLSKDTLEGLWLGASIHDIGKISVPAELLSKPGKLSSLEYLLLTTHAQAGYDIIKDVDFPWPIADMILQHHERLDGSGYPQGLTGDGIIMEARILSVADVFEAMVSDRPYRPAQGIEAAIEFIESGKGTLFDAKVVDACLGLARNKSSVFDHQAG